MSEELKTQAEEQDATSEDEQKDLQDDDLENVSGGGFLDTLKKMNKMTNS